jgi:hypothetical protein
VNKLRKAIHDYLALRRSLGFKLVAHEIALREFAAFLAGEKTGLASRQLLPWNGLRNILNSPLMNGHPDSASCADSPGTGVLRILRQKFPRRICCPIVHLVRGRTSIPIRKSASCYKPLSLCPLVTRCGPGPTIAFSDCWRSPVCASVRH